MLKSVGIARYTDRRRCAGLYSKKQRIIGIIPVHLLVAYLRKGIFKSERDVFRKKFMKRSIFRTRMI